MHFSDFQLLIGAFVLVLGIVIAVRALHGNRRARAARTRDYFGPEYNRDLLLHSSLSESEDWVADRHARFAPFRLRDPEGNEPR